MEEQPAKTRARRDTESTATGTGITDVDIDILHNIFSKLPAPSFAFAACVNRTWNSVCHTILSRPIMAQALSFNPSLPEAMEEVVGKVLSGPIRPHFAILCISPSVDVDEAHHLVMQKLGSKTPLITCDASGVIGREALTDEFREVMFPHFEDDEEDDDEAADPPDYRGISLTVGYVPGLKVDVIPLLYPAKGCINKFAMDITDYSTSVSGSASPAAIFIFGDSRADMKPVLEKLDYVLAEQTVVAGNEGCRFRWTSTDNSSFNSASRSDGRQSSYGAAGLVFASDKNAQNGAWKIDFHFAAGAGVTAVGPTYRVVSAKPRNRESTTWLTAKREGENESLDGDQILEDLTNVELEMGTHHTINYDLYIGVTKRRNTSFASEKVKAVTSLSYHPVRLGDEQYLYVGGLDIKTGDPFRIHVSDSRFALRQRDIVSENIRSIRHKEMVGGFLFSCCGRGSMYFGQQNVDSSPILDNFPAIPLSGMFCGAEIGRGPPLIAPSAQEEDEGLPRCCLHVYSSIYVLMSCTQPSCKPLP